MNFTTRVPDLGQKWVRLVTNETNSGFFKETISVHFGSASKNVFKSVHIPLLANLTPLCWLVSFYLSCVGWGWGRGREMGMFIVISMYLTTAMGSVSNTAMVL